MDILDEYSTNMKPGDSYESIRKALCKSAKEVNADPRDMYQIDTLVDALEQNNILPEQARSIMVLFCRLMISRKERR